MRKDIIRVLVFLYILVPIASVALDKATLGVSEVYLPPPAGYTNILDLSPECKDLISPLVPESNILLGYYVPTNDAVKLLKDNPDIYEVMQAERYYMLQGSKSFLTEPATEEDFDDLKGYIKANQDHLQNDRQKINQFLEEAGNEIAANSEYIDEQSRLALTIDNSIGLEDWFEDDHFFQFGNIMKISIGEENPALPEEKDSLSALMVSETAFVPANGQILYLYTYSAYDSAEDALWVQKSSKLWAKSILEANPVKYFEAESAHVNRISDNSHNAIENGLYGAVAGGIAALLLALWSAVRNHFKKNDD